jgi:hypothetical protein
MLDLLVKSLSVSAQNYPGSLCADMEYGFREAGRRCAAATR